MSIDPIKNSIAVRFPLDDLIAVAGGDWARRIESSEKVEPSEEQWAEYERAKEALDTLHGYDGWHCSDWDLFPPMPSSRTVYAESEAEWKARVQAKLDAGEWPKPDPFVSIQMQRQVDAMAEAMDQATTRYAFPQRHHVARTDQ